MRLIQSGTAALSLCGAAALSALAPGLVQASIPAAQIRSLNLARNTAVTDNGGLSTYRPEPCMFRTGDGGGDCLVNKSHAGYTFSFLGGRPGWPEDGSLPTTETEIQISADGRSVDAVIYNGVPR